MKGQKGITLVALVITIIVMLILAGVTISIVINGGLFDQARSAEVETKDGVIKDHIIIESASASAKINTPGFAGSPYTIAKEFADAINDAQANVAEVTAPSGEDHTATTATVTIKFNRTVGAGSPATGTFTVNGTTNETTVVATDVLYTPPTN